MFILDTNVVSELRKIKQGRCNPHVAKWSEAHQDSNFFISVITLMEIEIGILLLNRKDKAQAALLKVWLNDKVKPAFNNKILSIDEQVAITCAALHSPKRQSDRDAFIAATALVHNLTVVTRNVTDFTATGVKLINPFL